MTKRFDSRAWRLAERLTGAPKRVYRRVQEQAPGLVKRWDPAARSADVPLEVIHLCEGQTSAMTMSEKLNAFRHSVNSGAHGVAGALAEEIHASLPALDGVVQRRAIEALASHHIAVGNTEEAATLQQRIAATQDGRIKPRDVAQHIDDGKLGLADVSRLLQRRWFDVLQNPQLHLLSHRSVVSDGRATSTDALNRYLRTQGSDRVESLGESGHYLRDLKLAPARPVTGGPLVSVVISAYNAADTIEYAVRSIVEQSYQNLEVLVCDDNSSDTTRDILSRVFGADCRVSLFRSTRNQGTYNIRNALIAEARGELITVQDADDMSLPRRIEHQVKQLRVPTKKASITNLLRVKPDGRIEFFRDHNANRMAIVSLMAHRTLFRDLGPYRSARFGADFEFLEALKAQHGASAIARVRSPQMLCLWAEQSVTRQAGAQALSSGYRSPARRLYSDLVYRQRVLGAKAVSDADIDRQLRESGNWRDPAEIVEL